MTLQPLPDSEGDSLARAIAEEMQIVEYAPSWAAQFAAERDRVVEFLPGRLIEIEHIGSTAVPGLAAKPVIDLMAGVAFPSDADALIHSLCAHGYVTSAAYNATLPDRRWLMRHAGGRRTHHLHLVEWRGALWNRWLMFRDILRSDEATAARYADLKRRLAADYHNDREAYTAAKDAFIQGVLSSVVKR